MVVRVSEKSYKTDKKYRLNSETNCCVVRRPQRGGKGKGTEIAGKP